MGNTTATKMKLYGLDALELQETVSGNNSEYQTSAEQAQWEPAVEGSNLWLK